MSQSTPKNKTRRRFLLGGLAAGGALVVGWGIQPPRAMYEEMRVGGGPDLDRRLLRLFGRCATGAVDG